MSQKSKKSGDDPNVDDAPETDIEKDKIGYGPFAEAVASAIRSRKSKKGHVYAVHGPWGSGKTTAVNFILKKLSDQIVIPDKKTTKKRPIVVVQFNPWWFSGQDALVRAFLEEMAIAIGKVTPETEQKLRRYMRHLSGATAGAKYLMKLLPGGGLLTDGAMDALGEALGSIGEEVGKAEPVTKIKDEVGSALTNRDKTVLVIIDDIDRLTAEEQLQIFKLVKSVADLPKVLYLLIFDDALAIKALRDRSEFAAESNFLEKIVQTPFHLPPASPRKLEAWFQEDLVEIIGNHNRLSGSDYQFVFRYVVAPALTSPRAVVKLLNGVRNTWPSVSKDVNLQDFLAIETLRLFDGDIYTLVRKERSWLVGTGNLLGQELDEYGVKILERIPEGRRERAKTALSVLFPRFQKAIRGHRYGMRDQDPKTLRAQRRICLAEFFGTYFGFDVDDITIPIEDVERIVEEMCVHDKDALGEVTTTLAFTTQRLDEYASRPGLRSQTMLPALLLELGAHAPRLIEKSSVLNDDEISNYAKNFLSHLLNVGDRLLEPQATHTHFYMSYELEHSFVSLARDVVMRIDDQKRRDDVTNKVIIGKNTAGKFLFLKTLYKEHYKLDGTPMPDPNPYHTAISRDQADKLIAAFGAQHETDGFSADILSSRFSLYYLQFCADCLGTALFDKCFKQELKSAENAVRLAEALISYGTSGVGQFIHISPEIVKLIDVEALEKRLSEIEAADPPIELKAGIERFKLAKAYDA